MTGLRAARFALLLAFLSLGQSASAHGDEKHEDEAAQQVAATPVHEDAVPGTSEISQPQERADAVTVLKNLHPASVHFAIALFVVAGIVQLVAWRRPSAQLDSAVRVMVMAGGAGAVLAAVFGWIHTGLWFGGEPVMQVHRWLGTALAAIGAAMGFAAWKGRSNRRAMQVLVVMMAAAVLIQAFLGGELGHGAGHLFTRH